MRFVISDDLPRWHEAGRVHEVRLEADKWPRRGDNTLEVILLERDAAVLGTVGLRDVELEIKYLMGRSSPRGFVDADLGLYQHAVS